MRHFAFLSAAEETDIFHRPPQPFDRCADRAVLAYALGATLYMPATRPELAKDLRRRSVEGLISAVLCLEDAIPDGEVAEGMRNVVSVLDDLAREEAAELPLLFVRVRTPAMLVDVAQRLGAGAALLTGFVLPKFDPGVADAYVAALGDAAQAMGRRPYALPILESPAILYREFRSAALDQLHTVVSAQPESFLGLRIGATDMSGLLGLRRSSDLTLYDIGPMRDVISDIVNVFGRPESDHVISGPVWEYFTRDSRVFKPQLRMSPFVEHGRTGVALRRELLDRHLDGLIREVELDKAHGLLGKTVIHPTHVRAVNALSVVAHEEYADAIAVTSHDGGVLPSAYGNKMNEVKPHLTWARRVLRRADAFGVYAADRSYIDLLEM